VSEARATPRPTVGLAIPFFDHQMDYSTIRRVVNAAEQRGFDSIWLSDHITGPTPAGAGVWMEAVTLLSNLAAVTSTLTLGTDVLVAPYRHPLLCAKMLTTLDIVSAGRLIVAVGAGYIDSEFRDLGVPFDGRGAYTDECIEIWKAAWSPGRTTFHGANFTIDDALTEPKPIQRPHPPIWIGGSAPLALQRVVRHAVGWHPIGLSLPAYTRGVQELERLSTESAQEPPLLSYSAIFGLLQDKPDERADRPPLSGSPTQVLDDLEQLAALGVSNVVFRPGGPEVSNATVLDQIERIADTVITKLAPVTISPQAGEQQR
jgi:probable F420-dependent oxidoreductase